MISNQIRRSISVFTVLTCGFALRGVGCPSKDDNNSAPIVDERCNGALARPDCADGESISKVGSTLSCVPCGQGTPPDPRSDKLCHNGQPELMLACALPKSLVVKGGALACAECTSPGVDAGSDAGSDAGADAGPLALCTGCPTGAGCPAQPLVVGASCEAPSPNVTCWYCRGGDTKNAQRFKCEGFWSSAGADGQCN